MKPKKQSRGPAPLGGFRIGRVFGIDVRVHISLAIIFALIVMQLGAGTLPAAHPDWNTWTIWLAAVIAAVAFFASVLLHEFAHALVGRAKGIEVRRITLFLFGGVAHTEDEAPTPSAELMMAIAGPIMSLLIGVTCTAAGVAMAWDAISDVEKIEDLSAIGPAASILLWLGPVNLLLAAFNMLPGFPLDGGRVLRAILWMATNDRSRATRWAAGAGKGVALIFFGIGISMAFGVHWPIFGSGVVPGLWLVLIAWFLGSAAKSSQVQLQIRDALEGVSVGDLMQTEMHRVPAHATIRELVRDHLMKSDQRAFPVEGGDGSLVGLVRFEDVRRIDESEWQQARVESIMTPSHALSTVRPDVDVADVLGQLTRPEEDPLPVMDGGTLRGLIGKNDIARFFEVRGVTP